ncbi:MAG TPA: TrkA family potassium uptake protein [Psychromonas hadalis]|nr:TrkA family potassium uptake protein [Psychromonas hadalis]
MSQEHKQYLVIGLGRFGTAVCQQLVEQGAEVFAVDSDQERVDQISDAVTQAIVADCSNEQVVSELNVSNYDTVMIAIGDDINSSILTTLVVKEAGAKRIWVKSKDKFHKSILEKIGADKVISPEQDMGIRVAHAMLDKRILNYRPLRDGTAIAEIVVTHVYSGQKLKDHPCFTSSKTTLLAYQRGSTIHASHDDDLELEIGDILIIAGDENQIVKKIRKLDK